MNGSEGALSHGRSFQGEDAVRQVSGVETVEQGFEAVEGAEGTLGGVTGEGEDERVGDRHGHCEREELVAAAAGRGEHGIRLRRQRQQGVGDEGRVGAGILGDLEHRNEIARRAAEGTGQQEVVRFEDGRRRVLENTSPRGLEATTPRPSMTDDVRRRAAPTTSYNAEKDARCVVHGMVMTLRPWPRTIR